MMQKATDRLVNRIRREDPATRIVRIEPSPSGRGHKHVIVITRGKEQRLTCESDWDSLGR